MARKNYMNNEERIKADEKELEEMRKAALAELEGEDEEAGQEDDDLEEKEKVKADNDDQLDEEQKNWKKRYSDLRRHQTKTEQNLKKEIDDLKKQLESNATKQIVEDVPKTKKELAEWRKKYPDIADIVEEIAREQAEVMFQEAKSKLDKYDEITTDLSYAQAMSKIRKAHSDLDEILDNPEFHDWIETKPNWFSHTIYDQHEDTNAAIEVLNIYKMENGLTKKDKKESDKKAAKAVATRSSKPEVSTDGERKLRESDIEAMSEKEYEERRDEIRELKRKGLIEYDISGAAR